MKRIAWAALVLAAFATNAGAVSVMEVAGKCGDDAKVYCQGVGYGDAMTQCLVAHKSKLTAQCKAIVDRIAKGEAVTLF
jgi:hypothetical protein